MRAFLVPALALGLVLGACSGGGGSPKVATLGGTTTTVASSGGSGVGPDGLTQTQQIAKMTKYAECVRSHGVPDFPDPIAGPDGGAGFQIKAQSGSDLDPNSPAMQSAQTACKSLLPNGGVAPQLTAAQQQAFLNWAACIRAHGMPNFPDPDFSGGGVRIRIQASPGQQGPPAALQSAQQACKSKMPGGFGGGVGG
jgi:hypothetical protein